MLLLHEIRKLVTQPAILVFVGLALTVNLLYAFGLPSRLRGQPTESVSENVFADGLWAKWIHDTERAGETGLFDPLTTKILLWKYNLLQPEIEQKALRDDGDDDYFGQTTNQVNREAIEIPGKLLAAEGCILMILIVLYALTIEGICKTDKLILSSRTGRRTAIVKLLASVLTGCAALVLLTAATYSAVFSKVDFSSVWQDNISSRFHTVYSFPYGHLPFTTWEPMTVGAYLWGCIGVVFLWALVCALFAAPFALLIRRSYFAFLGVGGLIFLSIVPMMKTDGFLRLCFVSLPLPQILQNELWFSEGGSQNLLPHFELLYPLLWGVLFGVAMLLSYRFYLRKEIV